MADRHPAVGADRVAVVPMRSRHLRGVVSIEDRTSSRPWSKDLFASELKQATSRSFVAVRPDATVVGFACLMSTGFEVHLTNIAVEPALRRRGLASRLMLRLVDEARTRKLDDLTLEVRASNEAAQELYHRFGFAQEGVRHRYYGGSEDALIMWARDVRSAEYQRRMDAVIAALTASEPR